MNPLSAPISAPATMPLSLAQDPSPNDDLRRSAQAFEAIFLRQMLASARAADLGGDDLLGGPGLEQFTAMRDEHFAELASQQGVFGLAEAIERQIGSARP